MRERERRKHFLNNQGIKRENKKRKRKKFKRSGNTEKDER